MQCVHLPKTSLVQQRGLRHTSAANACSRRCTVAHLYLEANNDDLRHASRNVRSQDFDSQAGHARLSRRHLLAALTATALVAVPCTVPRSAHPVSALACAWNLNSTRTYKICRLQQRKRSVC